MSGTVGSAHLPGVRRADAGDRLDRRPSRDRAHPLLARALGPTAALRTFTPWRAREPAARLAPRARHRLRPPRSGARSPRCFLSAPKGRSICHKAVCVPGSQAQPGSIIARSTAHRPETRRNRAHFAARTRRNFLSFTLSLFRPETWYIAREPIPSLLGYQNRSVVFL